MVATQLRDRGILDEGVLAAMTSIPREAFVRPDRRDAAYRDTALPTAHGQTISQPWVVARMTELLRVEPGDRVLEIGTGSGYQAAILAQLGATVRSFERIAVLAEAARDRLAALGLEGVEVVIGDGSTGDAAGAPWDGIIVTAAAPIVPPALPRQLAIGARLVVPVGPRGAQELLVIERRGPEEWHTESVAGVVFVPLLGTDGYAIP